MLTEFSTKYCFYILVPGSNGFWLCGLHLYKPLPNIHVPGIGEIEEKFSSHCFVTAGNLGSEILSKLNKCSNRIIRYYHFINTLYDKIRICS